MQKILIFKINIRKFFRKIFMQINILKQSI